MYSNGTVLKTDADFYNAMLFGLRVTVYQDGEILDYGGVIKQFSEHSVTVDEFFFLRENCEFKVR
jgi:hypothetical protein